MPVYIYRCENGHEEEHVEGMFSNARHFCFKCCGIMARKPQTFMVNWGGLKPSQGDIPAIAKKMELDAERKRDEITPHRTQRVIDIENKINEGV